jgi:two-component system CheB/CheR fusion protein
MPLRRPRSTKAVTPHSTAHATPAAQALASGGEFPVVAIGASAGGLDTFRTLLGAVPPASGMAFILVQHLDPTHQSMLVELLTAHTPLTVLEAVDGMSIETEHLYIIPPDAYLSVGGDALHISKPQVRHGARLPFDFLLNSMAQSYGERAVCVVLSGTGADGSLGLRAIRDAGGLVIAQDPEEASFDGMPRNAIATGLVDLVAQAAKIPAALIHALGEKAIRSKASADPEKESEHDRLSEIVELLHSRTGQDFRLYKHGTLRRRIERRMALAAIEPDRMDRYLDLVQSDDLERERLAKDLLINITSFFRDQEVFHLLATKTIPDLVRDHPGDESIRIWIAGCSTGQETYSLAMLFREQIDAAKRDIKLQVFASDLDPDAVATAREGYYPDSIKDQVSAARLSRFFTKEEHGYRVLTDLRSVVVFTIQDVLGDPPFSRMDMISCRNLLIYLSPEAQERVIGLFHFALKPGGLLLLGSAETVGNLPDRFKSVAKDERLYRRIGANRPGDLGFALGAGDSVRAPLRRDHRSAPSRQLALAELCKRMVLDAYAPAAVLINARNECLFSLGPTDRYLRVAPGQPSLDLLAMARPGLRTKLRSAIQQAVQEKITISLPGGRIDHDAPGTMFDISVQPVSTDGEDLLLVCFLDAAQQDLSPSEPTAPSDHAQVADLEHELAATKTELRSAIRSLELSNEEQRTVNEEALSVNEEFQSTNEELLTSKEELQSLNEELTALNSQLHETLERQRTTANDLQNILYSTDVATLFLDADLNIRFFTPATKSIFGILPADIGRPLADLHSLAADGELPADAVAVLKNSKPIDREIEAPNGIWFSRRMMPYRAHDNSVEGVVITFTDVTQRKLAAKALVDARQEAELATAAKSRFLAIASHDLRQPLQSLAFLQGLLAKIVKSDQEKELVEKLDQTLGAMSGMLNTLLDINQIEAGVVRPETLTFPISDILDRLRDEFTYLARAQNLRLIVVSCSLSITSDPRLFEQMLRNLISNALKYTRKGRILVGCRRREGLLSVEVWDTGIGIAEKNLDAIFNEYHQVDNDARERSRGLGLGLSIVQRLADLLHQRVRVRSLPGKGSVFSIEAALPSRNPFPPPGAAPKVVADPPEVFLRKGKILVIEDDPELQELLRLLFKDAGHRVATASDAAGALDFVSRGGLRPDLILADYNLPNGVTGLQAIGMIREKLHHAIPAIILTGDISADTLREVASQDCLQLNKPVKLPKLAQIVQDLLPAANSRAPVSGWDEVASLTRKKPTIFVVDDSLLVREGLRAVLEEDGRTVKDYPTSEAFLDAYDPSVEGCLLVDAYLPGISGLALLQRLHAAGDVLPAIMITGASDVTIAVEAMKAGAVDFIEKPIGVADLLASVDRALEQSHDASTLSTWRADAAHMVGSLTHRQHEVMDLVLAGHASKNIAADLGISQRTVETHRASIMRKTGVKSLPALARMALAATAHATQELALAAPPAVG